MKHHKTPFLSIVMRYALPSIQSKIVQFLHLWFLHEIGQAVPACTIILGAPYLELEVTLYHTIIISLSFA